MPRPPKDAAEWTLIFLDALRKMPIVSHACDEAGITPSKAYKLRKRAKWFEEAWDDALETGIDHLEQAAWQAAQDGDRQLLMFLLKALRPAKYREHRRSRADHEDRKIEIVLTQVPAREDEES